MITAPTPDFHRKCASPARAMQLLFGASLIDAMPQDRTDIGNVGDLRNRAEMSRKPETIDPCSSRDATSFGRGCAKNLIS